jgi:peptidoglycan hydrolase-like protein with peptidoglycan-binding domain
MTRDQIIQLQQELANRGLYTATVDGQWGTESRNALAAALALIDKVSRPPVPMRRLA